MFSFKEVCFVAAGVFFIYFFEYATLFTQFNYILPHSVQGTEQKRNYIE